MCGQKSLRTPKEPSYIIDHKSSKAHLTPFIGVRHSRSGGGGDHGVSWRLPPRRATSLEPRKDASISTKHMQRARVDGAELEFEVTGAGEPVLLIHGAFIAEAYALLCAELALNSRYRLVRYHRRGYADSSPVRAPFSLGQQAADCRALLGTSASSVPTSSAIPPAGSSPCGRRSTRRNSSTPLSCSSRRCSTSQAEPCSPKRSGRCWSNTEPATRRARPTASFAGRSDQTTEAGSIG